MSHAVCAPAYALFNLFDVHVLAVERGPRLFTLAVGDRPVETSVVAEVEHALNAVPSFQPPQPEVSGFPVLCEVRSFGHTSMSRGLPL